MRSIIGPAVITALALLAPGIALAQSGNSGIAGVVLPWHAISTAFTYRDYPGFQITATQQDRAPQIVPSLGRPFSSGDNGTVNVALIEPGTMYGPRQRQLNSSTATGIVTTFGPNWQRPNGLQKGRWAKVGRNWTSDH